MHALEQNKKTLAVAVLLLLGLFLYNSFFAGPVPEVVPAESLGADLLKTSNNISKATLSRDLFSESGYRLLSDFSTALVSEPQGRSNPFAPIGQE
jgi:hypothetical protein